MATTSATPVVVTTKPFQDQKPGTSGLRKPTKVFVEIPNYTTNFIQSIITGALPEEGNRQGKSLIVGGDGRYYGLAAVQLITEIAAANKVTHIVIGQNGLLSTPAMSNLIRKMAPNCMGGIILTASHNPGGLNGDFGIKFNIPNGGPAPDAVTNRIFEISKSLTEFKICKGFPELDLTKTGMTEIQVEGVGNVTVDVIDPVEDYVCLMKSIFDFQLLKKFLASFPVVVDCMHGVTGPYVQRIFQQELVEGSGNKDSLFLRTNPLPDFGGGHPDPNQTYASGLVETLQKNPEKFQFGAAYDGDGDRNMLLGAGGFFVTPSDSLAILAANTNLIPYFKTAGVHGFARSMPTSCAVDHVGKKLGIQVYEVPTGWKYFGNLMDANKLSLCGEESFGTGSNHIREKDGIWASLAFLSVLAGKNSSVSDLVRNHWRDYGRNYFLRFDYENMNSEKAGLMMSSLEKKLLQSDKLTLTEEIFNAAQKSELANLNSSNYQIETTDNFEFTDIVDGSTAKGQGLRLIFANSYGRIVWRLSGTGSSGATVRVYFEKYAKDEIDGNALEKLDDLVQISLGISNIQELLGVNKPTVIT